MLKNKFFILPNDLHFLQIQRAGSDSVFDRILRCGGIQKVLGPIYESSSARSTGVETNDYGSWKGNIYSNN